VDRIFDTRHPRLFADTRKPVQRVAARYCEREDNKENQAASAGDRLFHCLLHPIR
jgi:hypothetical protein